MTVDVKSHHRVCLSTEGEGEEEEKKKSKRGGKGVVKADKGPQKVRPYGLASTLLWPEWLPHVGLNLHHSTLGRQGRRVDHHHEPEEGQEDRHHGLWPQGIRSDSTTLAADEMRFSPSSHRLLSPPLGCAGVNLKDAASVFKKKFASGASVTKEGDVDIQVRAVQPRSSLDDAVS